MKKRGFTSLECIVSMTIASIIVYIVTFSINNSFNLLNKNEEYSKMINLGQNYLNETKYNVKYNENYSMETQSINVDDFQINKIVTRQESHYNCYKIILEVKSQDRSVELESYVTKK